MDGEPADSAAPPGRRPRGPAARGAGGLLRLVTDPLEVMGLALVAQIPNLIFLAVLFFVVRLGLRLLRLFFDAVSPSSRGARPSSS